MVLTDLSFYRQCRAAPVRLFTYIPYSSCCLLEYHRFLPLSAGGFLRYRLALETVFFQPGRLVKPDQDQDEPQGGKEHRRQQPDPKGGIGPDSETILEDEGHQKEQDQNDQLRLSGKGKVLPLFRKKKPLEGDAVQNVQAELQEKCPGEGEGILRVHHPNSCHHPQKSAQQEHVADTHEDQKCSAAFWDRRPTPFTARELGISLYMYVCRYVRYDCDRVVLPTDNSGALLCSTRSGDVNNFCITNSIIYRFLSRRSIPRV